MNKSIEIEDYSLCSTQVDTNEFRLSIFKNGKHVQNFNVSLQPNNSDYVLPTFDLVDKKCTIPQSILGNMDKISDWLIKNEKSP
jgi:hypothetical protein